VLKNTDEPTTVCSPHCYLPNRRGPRCRSISRTIPYRYYAISPFWRSRGIMESSRSQDEIHRSASQRAFVVKRQLESIDPANSIPSWPLPEADTISEAFKRELRVWSERGSCGAKKGSGGLTVKTPVRIYTCCSSSYTHVCLMPISGMQSA